jgi:hypothetical protein
MRRKKNKNNNKKMGVVVRGTTFIIGDQNLLLLSFPVCPLVLPINVGWMLVVLQAMIGDWHLS